MKKALVTMIAIVAISASCMAAPATQKVTAGSAHSAVATVISWIASWF